MVAEAKHWKKTAEGYDPTRDPHLASWRERKQYGWTKMRCPQCKRVGYKPYVFPDGVMLGEDCGRCDHETGCGYHVKPSEWLKQHKDIDAASHANANYVPPTPPPAIRIDGSIVRQLYCLREGAPRNPLLRFWTNLLRNVADEYRDKAEEFVSRLKEALRLFAVGSMPGGYTVWWIVDETGWIRSGKCMKYRDDGHRDKSDKFGFSWIHSSPLAGKQPEGAEYVGCLFGLHQLKTRKTKRVHLVESEKTAVLMTMFSPDCVWMATMGVANLNASRLDPLIRRGIEIILHPDIDGYERWEERAEEIRRQNPEAKIHVSTTVKDNYWIDMAGNADILDECEVRYVEQYSK